MRGRSRALAAHGGSAPSPLRVGFVPLADAAPLVVAAEQGYFAEDGLRVDLQRQIGWGNVRDQLTSGQLHAAQALVGMPLLSRLGRAPFAAPLVAVMSLGAGADAITFANRLVDGGVTTAAALADRERHGAGSPPALAHAFGCSAHHYPLRAWLAAGGVDPERDGRLCVLPPQQVAPPLAKGYLDGYCCGEPYNTFAADSGHGRSVAVTADVVPAHTDKVLALGQRWAEGHPDVIEPLSWPGYLGVPAEVIHRSLLLSRPFAIGRPLVAAG